MRRPGLCRTGGPCTGTARPATGRCLGAEGIATVIKRLQNTGQEVYIGLDYGEVGGPSSEFLVGRRLTGAVIGVRGSFKKLQYDIFIGAPVKKPEFFRTAGSTLGVTLSASF